MTRKKLVSVFMSVVLLLTVAVPAFFAQALDSVSITFLFTDGNDIYPFFDLQVTDGTAEAYGLTAAETDHAGKAVNTVSALDALVAAHAVLYGSAFTAQSAADYLTVSYGYASKAFTQSANFGFVLNDATPNDGVMVTSSWGSYYTGYALDTTRIQNGDVLMLYQYTDERNYSDLYPVFSKKTLDAAIGESLNVSATGYSIMPFGCCEQSVINANTIPMAGAQLFLTQDFKTYTPAGSLNKKGEASVSMQDEGVWYLVIRGSVNGSPVIPNICKIHSEKARWFPNGLRFVARFENHILTIGVTIRFRDLNKKAADCAFLPRLLR